jgi:predicted outer membrane repeat protein
MIPLGQDSGMNIEKNVSLSRNVAGGIGGAVLAALESTGGAIITMREGVNIVGNVALDGGGVYIEGGALMISDDVECRENTCTRDGGGICASISEVTLERGVRLTDNVAAGRGGSLLARQTNVIMRDNVDVSRNKATEGGGLVLEVNSSWSASENITFEENRCDLSHDTGPIHICPLKSFALTPCRVGSAGENGGAVSANPGMSGCRMDLRDGVSFNRNTAGQSGGGLFLEQKAR